MTRAERDELRALCNQVREHAADYAGCRVVVSVFLSYAGGRTGATALEQALSDLAGKSLTALPALLDRIDELEAKP